MIQSLGEDMIVLLSENERKNIMFINFDKIVQTPLPILNQISIFLNTIQTKYTSIILDKEKVPRKISRKERLKKQVEIKKLASKDSVKLLDIMIGDYKSR